MTHYNVTK